MKLLLIAVLTVLLPLALSQKPAMPGGIDCKAYSRRYGPVCVSNTSSFPRPGATLQYLIEVSGSQKICCKAFTCTSFSCYMKYIGCGHHSWSSSKLPWYGDHVATPKMECKAYSSWTVSYSFRTAH